MSVVQNVMTFISVLFSFLAFMIMGFCFAAAGSVYEEKSIDVVTTRLTILLLLGGAVVFYAIHRFFVYLAWH